MLKDAGSLLSNHQGIKSSDFLYGPNKEAAKKKVLPLAPKGFGNPQQREPGTSLGNPLDRRPGQLVRSVGLPRLHAAACWSKSGNFREALQEMSHRNHNNKDPNMVHSVWYEGASNH